MACTLKPNHTLQFNESSEMSIDNIYSFDEPFEPDLNFDDFEEVKMMLKKMIKIFLFLFIDCKNYALIL